MSTRVDINETAVLEAFVNRLRGLTLSEGNGLTEKNCYISTTDEPNNWKDTVMVTVCPGAGIFPEAFQVGGGQHQCNEELEIVVTIWDRHTSAEAGNDESLLIDKVRGVYSIKKKILRQLVTADLETNYPEGTGGVNQFLRDLVFVTRCSKPVPMGVEGLNANYMKMSISFKVSFDHDLTS